MTFETLALVSATILTPLPALAEDDVLARNAVILATFLYRAAMSDERVPREGN